MSEEANLVQIGLSEQVDRMSESSDKKLSSNTTNQDDNHHNDLVESDQNSVISFSNSITKNINVSSSDSEANAIDNNGKVSFSTTQVENSDGKAAPLPQEQDSVRFQADQDVINMEVDLSDRMNKYISDKDLLYASIMVEDARRLRKGEVTRSSRALKHYVLYSHPLMKLWLYLMLALNVSLALFEKPAVPYLALPLAATASIEMVCLLFFLLRMLHYRYIVQYTIKFWRDFKSITIAVVIAITVIDMIVYIAMVTNGQEQYAVRVSRVLRPLFIVSFSENRQIRRGLKNIRRTIPKTLNVIILLLLLIAMFALLATKLFQARGLQNKDGAPYFTRYDESYWRLYVLLTTANDPDVMMPAYDSDNWFALFFICFLIVCYFIINNILLAVIYENYRKELRKDIAKSVFIRRKLLKNAYNTIKVWHMDGLYVTHKIYLDLMEKVNYIYSSKWKKVRSEAYIALIWHILDENNEGYIGLKSFMDIADLLSVEVLEVKDQVHYLERKFPKIYNSRMSILIRKMVMNKYFRYFFDLGILVNASMIGFGFELAEAFFLSIFNIEIILKLYTLGLKEFIRILWNVFDFLVIVSATVVTLVEVFRSDLIHVRSVLDFLLVLRVLRLLKLIGGIDRFKVIIRTILQILPTFATYGGILLIFYYVYAILGMEIFGGLIRYHGYPTANRTFNESLLFCGNAKLNNSAFYRSRYCSNNFNDILKSMVLLFELTVVNQWHVLASGFVVVTNLAARLYFITFHMIVILIILNIFIAFVLDAFMLEFHLSTRKFEHVLENKINRLGLGIESNPLKDKLRLNPKDNNVKLDNLVDNMEGDNEIGQTGTLVRNAASLAKLRGLRIKLDKRRNVEITLQKMFEGKLDITDDDEVDLDNVQDIYPELINSI